MLFPIVTLLSAASVAIASPMAVGSSAPSLLSFVKRQTVPSITESGIGAACLDVCQPGYDMYMTCYLENTSICSDLCQPDTLTNVIAPCVQCQHGETSDVQEQAIIEISFETTKQECANLLASLSPDPTGAVSVTDSAAEASATNAANAGVSAGAGVSAVAAEPAVSGESVAASQVESATATASTAPNVSTKPVAALSVAGASSSSVPTTSATADAAAVGVPFVAILVAAGIALAL